MRKDNFSLTQIRETLSNLKGKFLWKGLEEVANTKKFQEYLENEYPHGAAEFDKPVNRRDFLKYMGASILLGGLAGCKPQPLEKIVPYVKSPEYIIPGKPLYFATAMPFNGAATGLLAESHMGRPTKLDGNPEHPDSLGATSSIQQAAILGLYDPDRSQVVLNKGKISTWNSFTTAAKSIVTELKETEGEGFRVVTGAVTSPTLTEQLEELKKAYPKMKLISYESVSNDTKRIAEQNTFGEFVDSHYHLNNADIILSLDSDFLSNLPSSLRLTKEFSKKRDVTNPNVKLNRFYAVESSANLTGSNADHRIGTTYSGVAHIAAEIANKLKVPTNLKVDPKIISEHHKWIDALVEDLASHKGRSLVIAGPEQSPTIHALTFAINEALGNVGKTVTYTTPVENYPSISLNSLKELAGDLKNQKVKTILFLDSNLIYDAPSDLSFAKLLSNVSHIIHAGLYQNETSAYANWHLPGTHFLEMFSDSRASDGTATTIQPLIEPLYGGKSNHEILSVFLDKAGEEGEKTVKDYWMKQWGELGFEGKWRRALHDGLVSKTAFKKKDLKIKKSVLSKLKLEKVSNDFEINFRPDPEIWDGRFANNGWLQELPKPLTKITWDNPVLISPADAEKLGLKDGDKVIIEQADKKLEIPVWITPGQPKHSLTLFLGFGRKRAGKIGSETGFDVSPLRTSSTLNSASNASIKKTGKNYKIASTQIHHSMEGRNLARHTDLEDYKKHPKFAHGHHEGRDDLTFYPKHEPGDYAWGMSINLNACIGCNACVAACQSENNTPVVGKEEVLNGREMHWLRIDRYYEGDLDHPDTLFQPIACMHCENAPCEPVCPVGATVHSDEGLNEMVYNRCVGTRYCSNNCPYKVRRFNFYDYTDKETDVLKMLRNPDVTVRTRGVMEKCTFCVQRINEARITAKKENRKIRDGEVTTACQTACAAEAIVFGDIQDKNSEVSKAKSHPLNYGILTELNTFPRLTYLAKVTNPNPKLIKHGNRKQKAHH